MDFLGILDLVNKMGEAKRIGSELIEPASQMVDQAKFKMADTLGLTKEMVDEGDASTYKVIDENAFDDRAENFAKTAASLGQFDKMMKPGVVQATPMDPMQQVPPMPQAYSPVNYGQNPVNYGQMQPQGMLGQQPTYEQLLRALQSRGY